MDQWWLKRMNWQLLSLERNKIKKITILDRKGKGKVKVKY